MANYGLPLRFKAVEISTGKEVSTSKLVLDPADGQWYACYGGSTIHFDEEWVTEIQLYQSTGHHDANGKEVFFGDVLHCGSEDLLAVCLDEYDCVALKNVSDELHAHTYTMNYFNKQVVIGNIHHSREELERRAKEVRA